MAGVNTATSNASRIKVGDYGSRITLELENIEEESVEKVEWIRILRSDDSEREKYINVTDYEVVEGKVIISLPDIEQGDYIIEIKDDVGRIYPAEGSLRLTMVSSSKGAEQVYYVSYKDEILDEVIPIITGYMDDNVEQFKGEQGDKGDTVANPPKIYTRDEYNNLESYDNNTLYFIEGE